MPSLIRLHVKTKVEWLIKLDILGKSNSIERAFSLGISER